MIYECVVFFFWLSLVFSCCFNCTRWLWEGLSIYCCTISTTLSRTPGPSTVFIEKRGARLGDLFPRPAPCPSFGAFGQKVEIFDRSPLPVPFGMTMPFCPLVGGPGAVLLDGRGLVGSSSELSSWICLLSLAVINSNSSSFEAADCRADSVFGIVV